MGVKIAKYVPPQRRPLGKGALRSTFEKPFYLTLTLEYTLCHSFATINSAQSRFLPFGVVFQNRRAKALQIQNRW